MSQPISRLWFLGPPAAILLSLFVYYAKFPSMRRWVDTRFPWVEVNIGRRLPDLADDSPTSSAPSRRVAPSSPRTPVPLSVRGLAEPPAPLAPPVAPSYLTASGAVDVPKLAANRSAWPQMVALKKTKEFPAVVNGKAVGKVEVPAGTEAKLVAIQDGKLGVEYQGGGAWLSAEETDLAQRLSR